MIVIFLLSGGQIKYWKHFRTDNNSKHSFHSPVSLFLSKLSLFPSKLSLFPSSSLRVVGSVWETSLPLSCQLWGRKEGRDKPPCTARLSGWCRISVWTTWAPTLSSVLPSWVTRGDGAQGTAGSSTHSAPVRPVSSSITSTTTTAGSSRTPCQLQPTRSATSSPPSTICLRLLPPLLVLVARVAPAVVGMVCWTTS